MERHANEGTRPHYQIEDAAAKFAAGDAEMPRYFTKKQRTAWKKLQKLQNAAGVGTPRDGASMELYVVEKVRWEDAIAALGDRLLVESVFTDKNGGEHIIEKPNPLLAIIATCEIRLIALIRELGLSPSSRDKGKLAKSNKTATGESMAERHPELFGLAPLAEKTPTPFVIPPPLDMRTTDDDDETEHA